MTAMFQQRHYVAIAKKVAETSRAIPELGALMASELADVFAGDNPRFDRQRFIAACRGEPCNGKDR